MLQASLVVARLAHIDPVVDVGHAATLGREVTVVAHDLVCRSAVGGYNVGVGLHAGREIVALIGSRSDEKGIGGLEVDVATLDHALHRLGSAVHTIVVVDAVEPHGALRDVGDVLWIDGDCASRHIDVGTYAHIAVDQAGDSDTVVTHLGDSGCSVHKQDVARRVRYQVSLAHVVVDRAHSCCRLHSLGEDGASLGAELPRHAGLAHVAVHCSLLDARCIHFIGCRSCLHLVVDGDAAIGLYGIGGQCSHACEHQHHQ